MHPHSKGTKTAGRSPHLLLKGVVLEEMAYLVPQPLGTQNPHDGPPPIPCDGSQYLCFVNIICCFADMVLADESAEVLDKETYLPGSTAPKGQIPCYDPSTMQFLGHIKAMTPAEVSDSHCSDSSRRNSCSLDVCSHATVVLFAYLAADITGCSSSSSSRWRILYEPVHLLGQAVHNAACG